MNHRLVMPDGAHALYVLAHGAGAGMEHPFMERIARELGTRGVGTFRYEFAYMEAKKKRVDAPAAATQRVREAVAEAARQAPGVPLFAGGKSFGGRMTSTAQAESPLPGVRGLIFLGFPLHPPGRPSTDRAGHLPNVKIPMLFVQGTRDEFAEPELLANTIELLGGAVTYHPVEGGDHSFKVPKSSGSADSVMAEIADEIAAWTKGIIAGKPTTRV